jgi:DNA-binding transcriptional MocR family regulator
MINLKFNYPSIPQEAEIVKRLLGTINLQNLLDFPSYKGSSDALAAAGAWLNVDNHASDIIQCNSGNHALHCIAQTLRRHGHEKIITEPFTYPAFRVNAINAGLRLVPSQFDERGLTINGLQEIHSMTKASVVYIQPTIQNPTCAVMPEDRRREIAAFVRRQQMIIVEDDAYRFLHPSAPPSFLDIIPENTIHIFSLAKPFNSLLKTAFVVAPKAFQEIMTDFVRLTSSGASSLLSALATKLLTDDTLASIIHAKRELARERQTTLLPLLKDYPCKAFPTGFHLWVNLPEYVSSTVLAKNLTAEGIIVPAGTEFSVDNPQEGERYVRVALGAERNMDVIAQGLQRLDEVVKKLKPA